MQPTHRSTPRFFLRLVLICSLAGCYEDPPPGPLPYCLTPDEWVGRSCADFCENVWETTCVEAPECGGMAAVGYTRLDACPALEYYTELPQSCDDTLPESLTESVYLVACCCGS